MEKGMMSCGELGSKRFPAIVLAWLTCLSLFLIATHSPASTFDLLANFSKSTGAAVSDDKTDDFSTSSGTSGWKTNNAPPAADDRQRSKNQSVLPPAITPNQSQSSEFDADSCISRNQLHLYRKASPYKPSPYLVSKLREYEQLHKRCGPNTALYNATVQKTLLGSTSHPTNTTDLCSYIVWLPSNGLGNRIISMASSFLYAVLTNRVLLVHHSGDMTDLFCEPFPETSWFLPHDFPLTNRFDSSEMRDVHSFGKLMKANKLTIASPITLPPPPFLYLYLVDNYNDYDKLFYLGENQDFLRNVPWLLSRSDEYYAPSLFLMSSFRNELDKMFPDKETVFHHLGRYLFLPSNQTWGLITRFYDAYLRDADKRIGIQIRIFNTKGSPSNRVMDQILSCIKRENVLPQPENQKLVAPESKNLTKKAVLIASLYPEYYENLRNRYWMRPTETGEAVGFFQPSHESFQHYGDSMHNIKALAEMYLLSFSDELVTSSWSTFGHVAHGLAGMKPLVLGMPTYQLTPDPPCPRDESIEPCFFDPPSHDRATGKPLDETMAKIPHIRRCKNPTRGLKLVNPTQHR